MQKKTTPKRPADTGRTYYALLGAGLSLVAIVIVYVAGFTNIFAIEYNRADAAATSTIAVLTNAVTPKPQLDKDAYNHKLLQLAHIDPTKTITAAQEAQQLAAWSAQSANASSTATSSRPTFAGLTLIIPATASTTVSAAKSKWPVATVYPNAGALLPFNRIVAYYGNFYSTGMGVLGQYPVPQMLAMLATTTAQWKAADPSTPVIPAIDYIAVTAQGSPGPDSMYRARMPDSQIQKAVDLANQVHGIVILDVQVGDSSVQTEVSLLGKWLALPNVHLALDPEFDMHGGVKPGTVIGTMSASEINWAAQYLANIVQQDNLPPKILIVHRFTQNMVTNAASIKPLPEVQVVMDMDGWGTQAKKIGTYTNVIIPEPVQFTGFKLFYKNDLKAPSTGMLSPQQVLSLTPAPVFIQYQ